MQLLIFSVLLPLISCQSEEETAFHFSNPSYGRVVWIVDGSKLPWIGQYEYLSTIHALLHYYVLKN
ncbi:hypothetical protein ANCCEY_12430 [Ancylostoma ceylanicum]|uniref:Uncharacterized protein n=1 Tax=Ancylostoma ceylanicum TaxID=53326 RepID=A0A0D6LEY7_9BILA|nr:hypothetical protein ANCCEY_12430 [Ancylostoma ceylanicum]